MLVLRSLVCAVFLFNQETSMDWAGKECVLVTAGKEQEQWLTYLAWNLCQIFRTAL